MYGSERDVHMLAMERASIVDELAAALSYDVESVELAQFLARNRSQAISLKGDQVYVGRRRSEMATRAYHLDPLSFTQAVQMAGCAIRWS